MLIEGTRGWQAAIVKNRSNVWMEQVRFDLIETLHLHILLELFSCLYREVNGDITTSRLLPERAVTYHILKTTPPSCFLYIKVTLQEVCLTTRPNLDFVLASFQNPHISRFVPKAACVLLLHYNLHFLPL